MMVRLVLSCNVATTLTTLEEMFRELGGIPGRIISDNPKCFSLVASRYEPILNPAYERFAAHYGTLIECLPPRAPELKGKVERMIPFVRLLYPKRTRSHPYQNAPTPSLLSQDLGNHMLKHGTIRK